MTVGAGGGGGAATGSSVSCAVSVRPPPETEMSTTVRVVTATVEMLNPPAAANCGTITMDGTSTRSGREVETENVTSAVRGSAAVTRPNEPDEPEVVDGSSVSDVGCGCGVSVVVAWTETPCQVAVMVTGVSVATRLVGMLKEVDSTPAGTVTVAGGRAAGLELDRLTTAPPAGACPCSITMPPLVTPPFWRSGTPSRLSSEAGLTVKVCVVASEPIVAVIVTVTGAVTCPVVKRNRSERRRALDRDGRGQRRRLRVRARRA